MEQMKDFRKFKNMVNEQFSKKLINYIAKPS